MIPWCWLHVYLVWHVYLAWRGYHGGVNVIDQCAIETLLLPSVKWTSNKLWRPVTTVGAIFMYPGYRKGCGLSCFCHECTGIYNWRSLVVLPQDYFINSCLQYVFFFSKLMNEEQINGRITPNVIICCPLWFYFDKQTPFSRPIPGLNVMKTIFISMTAALRVWISGFLWDQSPMNFDTSMALSYIHVYIYIYIYIYGYLSHALRSSCQLSPITPLLLLSILENMHKVTTSM